MQTFRETIVFCASVFAAVTLTINTALQNIFWKNFGPFPYYALFSGYQRLLDAVTLNFYYWKIYPICVNLCINLIHIITLNFLKIFKNNGTTLTEWRQYPRCSYITSKTDIKWLTSHENVKRIEIGLRKPFGNEVFVKVIELPPKTTVVCSPNVQAPVGETDWEYCLRQTLKNVSHSSRHWCCPRYIVRLPSQHPPSSFSPPMFWIETKWISNDPAPKVVCEKGKQVKFMICVAK